MKERPILFSAPMVNAILSGKKTQTRRVVKPQPVRFLPHSTPMDSKPEDRWVIHHPMGWRWRDSFASDEAGGVAAILSVADHCPYGVAGDQLIVKEAAWMWCQRVTNGKTKSDRQKWLYVPMREAPVIYVADHPLQPLTSIASPETGAHWGWRKKIGRFLPKWASRITLEVTSIRVERLQDISEEDAIAEGVDTTVPHLDRVPAIAEYNRLWNSINGERPGCSWDDSPWLWVISFKKLEASSNGAAAE